MNVTLSPNLPESLAAKIATDQLPMRRVWGMLALRAGLTFALLLAVALIYLPLGSQAAFKASAAWWLWFVTITNIVCIILMRRFGRLEGVALREIYYFNRSTWKGDLGWFLLAILGIAAVAQPPGIFLAQQLWGNADFPNSMLFQALPLAAVYPLLVLMPISQSLAELPIYWGYVAPRLRASGMNRWLALAIVGSVLSVQHLFFAFQLDARYDLWLALKFLPFALWTGFVVDRRPTVLPYLMFGHLILDALLPLLLLMVSQGLPLSM